jgi:hypothetical protein
MTQYPNKRVPRLWGATNSEPTTVDEWRANFAAWLRGIRDHIEQTRDGETNPYADALGREGVFNPDGFTFEQHRLVSGFLCGLRDGGRLELLEPQTLLFWLDFLGEDDKRRAAWRRFEKQHGAVSML